MVIHENSKTYFEDSTKILGEFRNLTVIFPSKHKLRKVNCNIHVY